MQLIAKVYFNVGIKQQESLQHVVLFNFNVDIIICNSLQALNARLQKGHLVRLLRNIKMNASEDLI